ncbi:MAG: TonB-dependent receptor plug domain-containing protein, partial [Rariglobus sp.]
MAQAPAPAPAPVPQSDDAVHLPEVIVEDQGAPALSSPKFTAPLLDTPQTISVIPQSVFNQQGATNLTEVLRNTPGISFNAGENGFSTGAGNFSMRGFDASDSILIDGSRDQGNYLRDTFNVEQVEVAKGPAADNGRGSAGGYVNLVTKTPQAKSFIGGTASYGFDDEGGDAR